MQQLEPRLIEDALLTSVIDMIRICFVSASLLHHFLQKRIWFLQQCSRIPILYYLAIVNHLCGKKKPKHI